MQRDNAAIKTGKKMRKKGQYIILDAFIAAMMLAVGIMLILATRHSSSYLKQPVIASQDLASSLGSTKLSDLNDPLVLNMTSEGIITALDNTVLQQAAEFYKRNMAASAAELIRNVSARLIAPQYSFEVRVNNELIYSRASGEGSRRNQSRLVIASRKVLFGVLNDTVELWGPWIGEVTVWE